MFTSLPGSLRNELSEASATLRTLRPLAPEAIDAAPEAHFLSLRHALSAHYLALRDGGPHCRRAQREADVLAALRAETEILSLSSPRRFTQGLAALNHALAGDSGGWRTGFVRLGDDRMGSRIYFPPVSAVPTQLNRLRRAIANRASTPPLFAAASAYALLLNCHPFSDGNGRTARVLFNHLLHRAGMPLGVYLPLYEIARRSDGGYEIALRLAELRGEWEPFLRFVLNAIACQRAIAAEAGIDD